MRELIRQHYYAREEQYITAIQSVLVGLGILAGFVLSFILVV
jgi:hypothetical protein